MQVAGGGAGNYVGHQHQQHALYTQVLPVVRHVLAVLLENEFEESSQDVALFLSNFAFADGSGISAWMPPHHTEAVMRGRILEVVAHWIRDKAKQLDAFVPASQLSLLPSKDFMLAKFHHCRLQLEQAFWQSKSDEVLAEFVYSVVVELLGREAACLGSILAGMLHDEAARGFVVAGAECPMMLLAQMVRKLEELQAKVSKVVMEMYTHCDLLTYDDSKHMMRAFFQYYTVGTALVMGCPAPAMMGLHETPLDQPFQEAAFQVNLVDSFGSLLNLLWKLEQSTYEALAVDFEGVKLCRDGALCLVQMTISSDRRLVYVLDVTVLGPRAFTMQTPQGTCIGNLLEDPAVRKVWFDPRNDVDALWYQFGIMPRGIFDLQLAEVADRRNRGFNVCWVQSLSKCLMQCPTLRTDQRAFAERIAYLGKNLFEPMNGGRHEIFQDRPLDPIILVYAAHDSRYMLDLYDQYIEAIGDSWVGRVLSAGEERSRWCLDRAHVNPTSQAPDF